MDDAALSRRELLERAACAAGMAGAANLLPADTLLQAAARAQGKGKGRGKPLPKPREMQIDHFVVVMMENRSFDHYFGWTGETGFADGSQSETYLAPDGTAFETRHASSMGAAEWQGCGFRDPGHGWTSGRAQLRNGFMAAGSGNDEFALTYYDEDELGFIHDAASAYTLYDRWFCSQLGPTWPNRYYKWSGQSGGINNNSPPVATLGHQWETIFDVVLRNNPANVPGQPGTLTARYYNSDLPFSATFGTRGISWTLPLAEYYADCAAGTLPSVAFVDPPFRDGGGFDGNSADEHPHGDVRLGQAWMADVVRAFVESPNYRRGALFILYDEWGGFFDHVTPPSVPDDRQSPNLDQDYGQMGFRIPAVTISPWTRNRSRDGDEWRVDHGRYGAESILKLILHRFGLDWDRNRADAAPKRVDNANSIGESFNWNKPDFEPPDLPDPEHVVSRPCAMGGGDVLDAESASSHESDLAELEGLAEQFGFAVGDSKPHELFRSPDGVQKALAGS